MEYTLNIMEVFASALQGLQGLQGGVPQYLTAAVEAAGAVDAVRLPFSVIKLLCLAAWVYLCMYTVLRIEYSPLVTERYKSITNIFGLLFGPFILFILIVADVVAKFQDGNIAFAEILKTTLGTAFHMNIRRRGKGGPKQIELMDSAGRSFVEVYGKKAGSEDAGKRILGLTESIVLEAITETASDILIDPKGENIYSIRFRVDGVLRVSSQIDGEKCAAVVNSIKAIAGMDIAEKRRPQDGSFMAKLPEGKVYFRVASAGVLGGEKLSIRILNQITGFMELGELGIGEAMQRKITNVVSQPSGMVIICGPTGSGKTTTMYAMLGTIDFYTRNVVTVEDPVEYVLSCASQIEVNVKANITFANALRSILRQDPDVISVGEIRDGETADMAVQASQTGHLVLATLHSSSNVAALVRLMDLGVKPLMLASSVNVIISQRLVRKLCDNCKTPAQFSDKQLRHFQAKGVDSLSIMQANGCTKCHNTGYVGRTGIHDIMFLNDDVKTKLLNSSISVSDMKQQGDAIAKHTLKKEGMRKVMQGITTIDEVHRVTSNLG
jgi:general secretion pathway protein E